MVAILSPPMPRQHERLSGRKENESSGSILLQDVSWEEYDQLCEVFSERHLFMTYDQGELEIRMPSAQHDRVGYLFDNILAYVTRYLGVLIDGVGSATLRKQLPSRGLEPDRAFYLSHARSVLGKKKLDLAIDPPPDLAIETDIAASIIARMPIYAALGVPEVWRYDGQTLQFFVLQQDDYVAITHSHALPALSADLVAQWLTLGQEQGVHAVYDAVDAWWELRKGV